MNCSITWSTGPRSTTWTATSAGPRGAGSGSKSTSRRSARPTRSRQTGTRQSGATPTDHWLNGDPWTPGADSGAPAEAGQQHGLGVRITRHRRPRRDRARAAVRVLHRIEPGRARRDEPGVQALVRADSAGQVPRVEQMVGEQLHCVLAAREIAERQVHDPVHSAVLFDRVHRRGRRQRPGRPWISTEHITVKAVTYLGDCGPGQQRRYPQIFADNMTHQVADVPFLIWGARLPLVLGDLLYAGVELRDGSAEHRRHVHVPSVPARARLQALRYTTIAPRVA